MGKLYDRVMAYNTMLNTPAKSGDGVGMQRKYELWPIPVQAIEANSGATLEQNPEYE
jgi:hypothetical protein